MKMMKLVFVSLDQEYVNTIEYKLVSIINRNIEVEYITTKQYLKRYFEIPRNVDVLVISREIYAQIDEKPSCHKILWLLDEDLSELTSDPTKNCIYKYSSVRSIVERIDDNLLLGEQADSTQNTKIISVFSVAGGCGKTLAAMGLAYSMMKEGNRVLYISAESIQDFKYYMEVHENLSAAFEYQCAINMNKALAGIENEIKRSDIEYLLPFKRLPISYQVDFDSYIEILRYIKSKNIYDYIVIELSKELVPSKLSFLQDCDRTVLVTTQHKSAVGRIEELMKNITSFATMPLIICNRYNANARNYLSESGMFYKCEISEYINEYSHPLTWENVMQDELFSKTASVLV